MRTFLIRLLFGMLYGVAFCFLAAFLSEWTYMVFDGESVREAWSLVWTTATTEVPVILIIAVISTGTGLLNVVRPWETT
jgi:hypothetical protein